MLAETVNNEASHVFPQSLQGRNKTLPNTRAYLQFQFQYHILHAWQQPARRSDTPRRKHEMPKRMLSALLLHPVSFPFSVACHRCGKWFIHATVGCYSMPRPTQCSRRFKTNDAYSLVWWTWIQAPPTFETDLSLICAWDEDFAWLLKAQVTKFRVCCCYRWCKLLETSCFFTNQIYVKFNTTLMEKFCIPPETKSLGYLRGCFLPRLLLHRGWGCKE